MPRRSTGCDLCRQRKIRCDETRPHCLRCSTYGADCPGYRLPAGTELRFVDQTIDVARKAGTKPVLLPAHAYTISTNDSAHATKRYRWQHQFSDNHSTRQLAGISSRSMHRVQLLSTFLDLWLPQNRNNIRTTRSHIDYIIELPNIDLSTPVLQVSIDALCLVEIGSLYQDERCLNESQARYTRALSMLGRELARPKPQQPRRDHVLAAITVLTLCELFDAFGSGPLGSYGWISHVTGAQRYIESQGIETIETEFGRLLFQSARYSSLYLGLVQRKAVVFASPKWLHFTRELAQTDPCVALYDIALQIPGILERADLLRCSAEAELDGAFAKLCTDTCWLRGELDAWLDGWYPNLDHEVYDIVDVRTMNMFSDICFERLFQTVYAFKSWEVSLQHMLYWISCILLDYTFLSICKSYGQKHKLPPLGTFTPRTKEDFNRELFVAATSFCRLIPYSFQRGAAAVGRTGNFLLTIVEDYFKQFAHCNELEWCRGVRRMLGSGVHTQHEPTTGDDRPRGPWNVKHKCKQPRCSFLVRCCAPAPQLLDGEYGYAEYVAKPPSPSKSPPRQSAPVLPIRSDGLTVRSLHPPDLATVCCIREARNDLLTPESDDCVPNDGTQRSSTASDVRAF